MNRKMLMLGIGVAVGYVLGARDGRERYDAMKAKATQLWENPRVTKARKDVEAYARQQAPIIRERAEAVAKAAPGVVADTAKDVAEKVSTTAKDVASKTATTAKDVASKTATTAKDVAEKASTTAKDVVDKASTTAKDVAAKTTATAKDVAGKVTGAASDVRDQAGKVAADLRDRGEAAVDTAVITAGTARDNALAALDDDEDAPKP